MADFTHFDDNGKAKMVNVGSKDVSLRTAVASGRVYMNEETLELIRTGGIKKGDVLTVAHVAGIMAAKKTSDLIPMCHNIPFDGIEMKLSLDTGKCCVDVQVEVSCHGRTGVEMEALTAVSVACLTVYDMCKAVQKDMTISEVRLESKSGGIHGDYQR